MMSFIILTGIAGLIFGFALGVAFTVWVENKEIK